MDTRLRYVMEWDQHSASLVSISIFFPLFISILLLSLLYILSTYLIIHSFTLQILYSYHPPETHSIKTSIAAPQAALSGTACKPGLYNILCYLYIR
ncbi:hypothetical protein BDW67DRAFT_2840 [Aspergillus spinulosporus]